MVEEDVTPAPIPRRSLAAEARVALGCALGIIFLALVRGLLGP